MNRALGAILTPASTLRYYLLLFMLLLPAYPIQAQFLQGGASFLVGLPQGAFKENVNRAGIGITGNFGLAPASYAYMIGVQFGYMNYGTNLDDFAFSYGGGAGVLVLVFSRERTQQASDKPMLGEVLIDLRCSYMAGSQAEYLKEGSIRRVSGQVVYDIRKSQTDLLMIQLEVAFRFRYPSAN
jgi:hypothetical protein